MASQTRNAESEQSSDIEQKVEKFRELYADALDIGPKALENVIQLVKSSTPAAEPPAWPETGGRLGRGWGKVSELTVILWDCRKI